MKKYIKIAVFFCTLILGVIGIEMMADILYPSNDIVHNWKSFYIQEKNSIDVLIVGSSHAFASFDVEMMEEETGKHTYILASNSQNITQTYYNVKEALKYQKPECIILETFGINDNANWQNGNEENYDRDWKKESNIDGMHFNWTKCEAIAAQYTMKNWGYALCKIARTHTNWKDVDLIKENIEFYKNDIKNYNTFRPSKSSMSMETALKYSNMKKLNTEFEISSVNVENFYNLAKLCRENDITLYMVMAPMYDGWTEKINYESRYQKILELAEEEKIVYIDCNKKYDEIGLLAGDFEDAYNDNNHLNMYGAKKMTSYIIEELFS